ncbi:MAG: hypothetical protein QXT72_02105 [Candidatus Micrarchaeia archaeon]
MKRYFIFENRPVWYSYVSKRMKVYLFDDPSFRAELEKDFLKRSEGRRNAVAPFHRIEKEMSTIAVVTDLNVSGEILYNMLKSRVNIEQAYETFKNTLDANRSYMRNDYAMQGRMFVNFISLLHHYRIYNILRKKDLLRKYILKAVLDHLQKVNKLKISKSGNSLKYQGCRKK